LADSPVFVEGFPVFVADSSVFVEGTLVFVPGSLTSGATVTGSSTISVPVFGASDGALESSLSGIYSWLSLDRFGGFLRVGEVVSAPSAALLRLRGVVSTPSIWSSFDTVCVSGILIGLNVAGLVAGEGDALWDFLSRSFRSAAAGVTGSFGEGVYGDATSSWDGCDGGGDDSAGLSFLMNLPVESLTRPLLGSGVGGVGVPFMAWRRDGDGLLEVEKAGLRLFPHFPRFPICPGLRSSLVMIGSEKTADGVGNSIEDTAEVSICYWQKKGWLAADLTSSVCGDVCCGVVRR
jgi:hypothetical protein